MRAPSELTKTLFFVAAALAGAGVAVYVLHQTSKAKRIVDEKKSSSSALLSRKEVRKIAKEVLERQEATRCFIRALSKELKGSKEISVAEVCTRVRDLKLQDPLTKYGLSMLEFDQLLSRYEDDPKLSEMIRQIVGGPGGVLPSSPGAGAGPPALAGLEKIVEVHKAMGFELDKFVAGVKEGQVELQSFDGRILVLAAEAVVGARIAEKYSCDAEDVEAAIAKHGEELAVDQEFARVRVALEKQMLVLSSF